jgi:hypothetical protein
MWTIGRVEAEPHARASRGGSRGRSRGARPAALHGARVCRFQNNLHVLGGSTPFKFKLLRAVKCELVSTADFGSARGKVICDFYPSEGELKKMKSIDYGYLISIFSGPRTGVTTGYYARGSVA